MRLRCEFSTPVAATRAQGPPRRLAAPVDLWGGRYVRDGRHAGRAGRLPGVRASCSGALPFRADDHAENRLGHPG